MKKGSFKTIFLLQLVLVIYSLVSVCSKLAAANEFMSVKFCVYYLLVIVLLGVYALFWQQLIKRMPLTTAFANKAVTVVWGIIWGIIIFGETISIRKIAGAIIVMAGVILFAYADKEGENE